MKLALYLPGFMRTYKKTLESYKKLTKKYEVDVYISTWNIYNINDNTEININEIINDYLNIDCKNVYIESENFNDKLFDKNIVFMYYKLYKTHLLCIYNNKKYDVFLRSRPDIWLFNDYYYKVDINSLYLQSANLYDITCIHNDRFFYGDEIAMNTICNMFKDIQSINPEMLKHAHGIIYYYCNLKKVNMIIFDKENTQEIIR